MTRLAFLSSVSKTLCQQFGDASLLLGSNHKVNAFETRNLVSLELGVASCDHHKSVGIAPRQTVNRLAALVVRHFGDRARVDNTNVCAFAFFRRLDAQSFQTVTQRRRLRKVQFAAKREVGCLQSFQMIHAANLRKKHGTHCRAPLTPPFDSRKRENKTTKERGTKSKCGAKHTLNLLPSLGKVKRYVICLFKKKYFFPKKARKSLEGIRKSVPLQRFKKTIDCFTKNLFHTQ